MKLIPLTQGLFSQVDDEDFEFLSQFNWCAAKDGKKYYAVRAGSRRNVKRVNLRMHCVIMKSKNIDHIDGNSLNNQKSNLRPATQSQNSVNVSKKKGCSSIYKGVYFNKPFQKWCAQIRINKKKTHIGYFSNEKDAAIAYDIKAKETFGEYAKLNFGEK